MEKAFLLHFSRRSHFIPLHDNGLEANWAGLERIFRDKLDINKRLDFWRQSIVKSPSQMSGILDKGRPCGAPKVRGNGSCGGLGMFAIVPANTTGTVVETP